MADTYKQSRIERDLLPDAPQEVNLQQFRVHSRDVIDKNFRPRSINAKNKSFILRDFTNSTLEEIVASQNFDAPRESTDSLLKKSERKLNRAVAKKAKQPTGLHKVFRAESSAESDSQKSSDDEDDDNGNCNSDHESQSSSVLTSLEDTIAVQPTRWDMAEQQFVELFFGQDLILRSRQRHQHILEAIKNHKNSLPKQRPKSPLKNVTFNLKRNLHYDFRPYPEVTVDSSETVASSTAATSTESDDDSNITHENYLTAVLENAKLSDSSRRGIKTAEAEPLRVVRPRTAELSPEMKSRLEKFRELDSFAFIRPDDLHLSRVGSIGSLRNFKAGQMAPRFSIYGGSRKISTAARLLLARNSVPSKDTSVSSSSKSSASFSRASQKSTEMRLSSSSNNTSCQKTRRPASSAHTFNAPACDQVVLQHSFATPKHKRPLSKGVRKFLVDAAIEDSVHPKLGNFSTLQNDTVYEHQNIQSAMVTVPSTENVLTGLHYYLHPPALPAPGLGLVPYDIFSMNPPTQVFKLQIPQKLSKSLQDPRNLVGLEGEKAGGRILMRKINALYDVPKCPKVGGRITPIEKPETPNNDHYYSESIFSSAPSREDTESIFSISTAPSCNPHNSMVAQAAENQKISSKISSPLNNIPPKSPSVNQILQLMVLQNPDIYSSHEKSRKTRQQVQLSFTNNVGRMFPLDYFMDHEEMTILVDRVTEHVNCTKLVDTESQMPKKIHCKGFVSTAIHAEVWHPGFISLYNDIRKEFLVEWDNATPFSYPPKRPINHLLTPDPTHSSRWLTRAEINLESDTLAAHLLKLYTADRIRAEFESRATLLQICGVLAPLLIPGLPEFQKKDTIRVIYAQVGIVQQAVRRSKIRGAKFGDDTLENAEDILTFQTYFLASIMNEVRDEYFKSQVEACVKINPQLESLYLPKKLKKLLTNLKQQPNYSINPENFNKCFQKIQDSPFLLFSQLIGKSLSFMKQEMMLDFEINDVILQIDDNPEFLQHSAPRIKTISQVKPHDTNKKISASRRFKIESSPVLTKENLFKMSVCYSWNDMYLCKRDFQDKSNSLFDETAMQIKIKTIIRKNMKTLKLISLRDFRLISDYLFRKLKEGILSKLPEIMIPELSKLVLKCQEFLNAFNQRKNQRQEQKDPRESKLLTILLSNFYVLQRARYIDLIKCLRDGSISIGIDTRLLLSFDIEANLVASIFPMPPFTKAVQVVAEPEPIKVSTEMNKIFANWIHSYKFNVFQEVRSVHIFGAGQSILELKNTEPIDHRALSALSQEIITDTLNLTQSLIQDRYSLIEEWIREFENSVKCGILKCLASNDITVSPRSYELFGNFVFKCIVELETLMELLDVIDERAAYIFTPRNYTKLDEPMTQKKKYYKHLALSFGGLCEFEVRGFCAVRFELLSTGIKTWSGRWRDWMDSCCQVLVFLICEDIKPYIPKQHYFYQTQIAKSTEKPVLNELSQSIPQLDASEDKNSKDIASKSRETSSTLEIPDRTLSSKFNQDTENEINENLTSKFAGIRVLLEAASQLEEFLCRSKILVADELQFIWICGRMHLENKIEIG